MKTTLQILGLDKLAASAPAVAPAGVPASPPPNMVAAPSIIGRAQAPKVQSSGDPDTRALHAATPLQPQAGGPMTLHGGQLMSEGQIAQQQMMEQQNQDLELDRQHKQLDLLQKQRDLMQGPEVKEPPPAGLQLAPLVQAWSGRLNDLKAASSPGYTPVGTAHQLPAPAQGPPNISGETPYDSASPSGMFEKMPTPGAYSGPPGTPPWLQGVIRGVQRYATNLRPVQPYSLYGNPSSPMHRNDPFYGSMAQHSALIQNSQPINPMVQLAGNALGSLISGPGMNQIGDPYPIPRLS